MAYTYKKRTNTAYSAVKNVEVLNMKMYQQPNPYKVSEKTGGNCTWWAWGRFREVAALAGKKIGAYDGPTGDAYSFYTACKAKGFSVGTTPKPGAMICWGYGSSSGDPGHVAFVEYVYSNGDIEISQSGWSSGPMKNEKLSRGDGKRGKKAYHRSYGDTYFNGFIYNKVTFTNPDGTVSNVSSKSSTHSRSWYINKYGTGAQVYFLLKDAGYMHKACCAILGNMQQESGIRVKTGGSSDGNGSEGLCQWTFGRKTKMQTWAKAHSSTGRWDSVDGQVSYLVHELKTSYTSVNKYLKNKSHSRDEMVEYFCNTFEVPDSAYAYLDKRKSYAKTWSERMSGAESTDMEQDTTYGIDMQKRSSQLYSSDNFEHVSLEFTDNNAETKAALSNQISNYLSNITFTGVTTDTAALPENYLNVADLIGQETKSPLSQQSAKFALSEALVQAPFVELTIGSYTIGSFQNSLDYYPNHITGLNVTKINGEINQYTITLIHQIRAGEDPQLLDKLFSKVRYSKINIRYGDCNSNSLFKDVEAVITNITQNRDYAGKKITYTLYATSTCNYVTSVKFNFPTTVNQPSAVIRNLLYNSGTISQFLIKVFPGMANSVEVEKNGWLPTNDAVLKLASKSNISILDYLSYLVGCMSDAAEAANELRNSTYFLTYEDATSGAYFKVTERTKTSSVSVINVYDLMIGYPDGNDVFSFNIKSDTAWALLYNQNNSESEFFYDINTEGNITQQSSKSLFTASNIMNEKQKNWWSYMVNYPVSAQLVMRGLLKPVNLMDYINIDIRFYGVQHSASGLYTIVGQQDVLDISGFRTNLDLVKVSGE